MNQNTKKAEPPLSPDDLARQEQERRVRDYLNRPSALPPDARVLLNDKYALALDARGTHKMAEPGSSDDQKKEKEKEEEKLNTFLIRQSFASFLEKTQKSGLVTLFTGFVKSLLGKDTPSSNRHETETVENITRNKATQPDDNHAPAPFVQAAPAKTDTGTSEEAPSFFDRLVSVFKPKSQGLFSETAAAEHSGQKLAEKAPVWGSFDYRMH